MLVKDFHCCSHNVYFAVSVFPFSPWEEIHQQGWDGCPGKSVQTLSGQQRLRAVQTDRISSEQEGKRNKQKPPFRSGSKKTTADVIALACSSFHINSKKEFCLVTGNVPVDVYTHRCGSRLGGNAVQGVSRGNVEILRSLTVYIFQFTVDESIWSNTILSFIVLLRLKLIWYLFSHRGSKMHWNM